MSLFDRLVDQALAAQADLAPLRVVVEKELLHHEILRAMSVAGLLARLTFIGGTCLRACHGSRRLSEDLDFSGGHDFNREKLAALGVAVSESIQRKYDLAVTVADPVKEAGLVDTWKVKVVTRPEARDRPAQHIHIDICAIPSYDRRPRLVGHAYGVDLGTGGLFVQAESREEILADKLMAFALRPNRVKHRDLWDIAWLRQQRVTLPLDLVRPKIADHRADVAGFVERINDRLRWLQDHPDAPRDFAAEMGRFLPAPVAAETVAHPGFWPHLLDVMSAETDRVVGHLAENPRSTAGVIPG